VIGCLKKIIVQNALPNVLKLSFSWMLTYSIGNEK
jgi:hypothetical protein